MIYNLKSNFVVIYLKKKEKLSFINYQNPDKQKYLSLKNLKYNKLNVC